MAKYRITNYGATRRLPYKGTCYEISHNSSIETDDRDIAVALSSFQFVDMEEVSAPPKAAPPKAAPAAAVAAESEQPDLSTMKKRELLELAEKRGIELPKKITKRELIEKLNESDNKDERKD